MSLREALRTASDGREVSPELLEAAFGEIMDGGAEALCAGGLLVALRTKGETVGELVAIAKAMRARANRAALADLEAIDTCGTGGDAQQTFNISTAAAFVAAGAGACVAKHGNRAASSRSGSFDVLEALGVVADLPIERAAEVVAEVGIGFLYARRAHPAMRHLGPIREALGLRTVMNCLGPLLNPLGVRRQLVGVYDAALVDPIAHALAELGAERALVVHGAGGLDEIALAGPTEAARLDAGRVERVEIDPASIGVQSAPIETLVGGDPETNATIIRGLLAGRPGPPLEVVVANAGAALWVAGRVESIAAGVQVARESIASGAATEKLEALIRATGGAS